MLGIRTTEEPSFQVVRSFENELEVRKYDKMVWAEVLGSEPVEDGQGENRQAAEEQKGNENFRTLFKYITGSNQSASKSSEAVESQSIPMTAPVFMTSDRKSMSFVLPESMQLDDAPTPTNERVKLREIPSKLVASLRFSGSLESQLIEEKTDELRRALAATDYRPIGEVLVAGYDPPWTVPLLRRNEVLVEVQKIEEIGKKQ